MNQFQQPLQTQSASHGEVARNQVLRNTYWLLAVSMIPTIFGAWLALQLNLNAFVSPGLSMIVFFVGAFGLMFLVERNKNSSVGVFLLLLFTFFMGLMLSRLIGAVLHLQGGAQMIMMAFGGTAVIFATMATIASTSKRNFTNLQKTLTIGAIVLIVACIGNLFFAMPALTLAISVMAMIIFSAFILVDIQRIIQGGETNYISATLALYLDIYNVFTSLLSIIGITSSRN